MRRLLLGIIFVFECTHLNLSAQVIQLGSGTNVTTTTTASPVNVYYRRFVSQFVYTANEINAAGGAAGLINQLGFYVEQAPLYALPSYTIKIKHVTANNVNAALGTTGWTTVKNSFTYSPTAGGYDMILFDTPFNWNGTNNIGIEICCSQVMPNWNQSGTCRYYNTNNGYRYTWTDNTGNSCGTAPSTRTEFKPQCQLIFSDETIWTGAINNNWFNANNWTRGVPNSLMHANIPSGVTNFPRINAANASCNNITINNGASLTILGTNSLSVFGNWINNGTFTANSSTIEFKKATVSTLTGVNNQQFFNLKVLGLGGVSFNSGSYAIQGSLYAHGGTITTNDRITLISNSTGTGRIPEIKTQCTYTLNMFDSYGDSWNGGYLTVLVDGVSIGTFEALNYGTVSSFSVLSSSTITLNYTSGTWENENTFNLVGPTGTTLFSAGPNIPTGNIYSTTSQCTVPDPFVGNVGLQRFLSLNSDGWREMTAPMTGQTLANWQDDGLTMSNFPGSNFPNFGWTSVYTYNENLANGFKDSGWVGATNITNALSSAKAHRVYIGQGNFTVNVKGNVNVGNYTFNLDYQNILPNEIAADINQKGWNLIGNPFPCTINWDNIPLANKVNIYNSIWTWAGETGNYGLYIGNAGVGTNGVNNRIASSQGFWVHASNNNPSLVIQENHKVDVDKAFVKNTTPNDFFALKLSKNGTLLSDEMAITFNNTYLSTIDENDGLKLFSPLPEAPSLYMLMDTLPISINATNEVEEIHIPVVAKVNLTQNYTLSTSQFHFNNSHNCMVLEDLSSNSFFTIDSNFNQVFLLHANVDTARFILHVYPPLNVEYSQPNCYNSNDGSIVINSGGTSPYDFDLFTSNGTLINQYSFDSLPAILQNLSGGIYVLSNVNGLCPVSSEIVLETQAIQVNHSQIDASCNSCNDGQILLTINGGNPPYQVSVNGVLTDSLSNLSAGTYTIDVVDNNNCSVTNIIEVNVDITQSLFELYKEVKVFPNPAHDFLNINHNLENIKVQIVDITGRVIITQNLNSVQNRVDINNLASGQYIIVLDNISSFTFVKL